MISFIVPAHNEEQLLDGVPTGKRDGPVMRFLGLHSDTWRHELDRQLRRVGYRLGRLDETSDDEVAVEPLGRGDSFLLQVRHYQEIGWQGSLYPARDPESDGQDPEPLADWFFDTGEKHAKSCYDVWIDWIVQAVRDAPNPK